jgi:CRISPR/Cas system CSM-associated protein Csm3 (group 7 of RAMP superfamily)
MARNAVNVNLTLIFDTPPSIAAAGAFGSIADRVILRNARGQFIVPGSQVKGKVRHACEQLVRALPQPVCEAPRAATMCPNLPDIVSPCVVCSIFGSPAVRSPLRFTDLVWDSGQEMAGREIVTPDRRAMVGLNRRRATAAEGRLFLVETAPYFPELRFTHAQAITGSLDSPAHVKLVLAGLRLIVAWGGMKSRGLGWTTRVDVAATFNGQPVQMTDWQEVQHLWNAAQ